MKNFLKWAAISIGGLLGLGLIAFAVVWIWGGQVLNHTFVPEDRGFSMEAGPADVAEGERLAHILGCTGCHRKDLEGGVLFDQPMFARVAPPNISSATDKFNDSELELIIRQGIKPDGRPVVVMPSSNFSALRDQDLRNLIAYLDQAPKSDNDPGPSTFGIMARFFFAKGEFKTEPQKEMYEVTLDRKDDRVFLEGDYLTRIKCSECHGRDLRGGNLGQDAVPSLVLVKAYNEEEFSILMRTGMARGDREVGFMTELSKTHFVHLTDDEVRDLYQFLLNADT